MTATFQDVMAVNRKYEAGASLRVCQMAVDPANEIFGGDALKGLLYISADGFAISVKGGREARLEWNRQRAESESVWIRERYDG